MNLLLYLNSSSQFLLISVFRKKDNSFGLKIIESIEFHTDFFLSPCFRSSSHFAMIQLIMKDCLLISMVAILVTLGMAAMLFLM